MFGTDATDYRKKDEVFTSVKVRNPPGGRSNIQFGWTSIIDLNAACILKFLKYLTKYVFLNN